MKFNKTSQDGENLKRKIGENQSKIHNSNPNNYVNNDDVSQDEEINEEAQQAVSPQEQIATQAASTALSAATGIPKPIADGVTKALIEKSKNSWACRILKFLGVSPTISNNPILSKLVLYGIAVIFSLAFFIILITSINGRIGSQRSNVVGYLSSGTIEDEETGTKTSLAKYLKQEGFCKGTIDCWTSDAYKFYSSFRKQIKSVESKYNIENNNENCSSYGYLDVKLDTALLMSTISFDRSDEELLRKPKDKTYDEIFKVYKEEIDNLTDAMIGKETFYVNVKGEKVTPEQFDNQKDCNDNGFKWDSNNGFCTAANSTAKLKTCYLVSETNYSNYILGTNEYYNNGGVNTGNAPSKEPDTEEGRDKVTNPSKLEFIEKVGKIAKEEQNVSGIYASVTIAQAITESSWGKSGLSKKYNNYYGMKAICKNPAAGCKGNEYWSGKATYMCNKKGDDCAWYRVYDSLEDSIYDHGRNMWKTSVYKSKGVLEPGISNEEQLKRIAQAGYASANNYYKLIAQNFSYETLKYDKFYTWNGQAPNYSSSNSSSGSGNNVTDTEVYNVKNSFKNYLFIGDNYINNLNTFGSEKTINFNTISDNNKTSLELINKINTSATISGIDTIVLSIGTNDIVKDLIGGQKLGIIDAKDNKVYSASKINDLINTIKGKYPSVKIFLLNVLPIRYNDLNIKNAMGDYTRLNLANINTYNSLLQNAVVNHDVSIIDARANLVTVQGYLKSDLSEGPMYSLKTSAYETWLQNIYNEIKSSDGQTTTSNKGGYISIYRPELIEGFNDIYEEKVYIYNKIKEEAKSYGSAIVEEPIGPSGPIIDETGGNYTKWKQYDGAWGHILMGKSGKTIKSIGCASTAIAIQIARSGVKTNVDNFNPGTFVQAMNKVGGYTEAGNINWTTVSQIAPNFKLFQRVRFRDTNFKTNEQRLAYIKRLYDQGYYLIVSVKNAGHWVAVESVTNNQIYIYDPGYRDRRELFSFYNIDGNLDGVAIYQKVG